MWQYQQLNQVLSLAGQGIDVLQQNPQGAWTFEVEGITVRLGKEDVLQRMKRFMQVYKTIRVAGDEILSIDTRYPNGVAVAWNLELCKNDCYAGRERLERDGEL